MAAFTDQFDRRSPLAPDMALSLSMRLRTALSGSMLLLEGRTAQERAQIATAIDAAVAREANRQSAKLAKSSVAKHVPAEALDPSLQREIQGDLSLFRAAGGYGALPAFKSMALVQPWEVWAVLAVWKAFDYLDALDSLTTAKPNRPRFQWADGGNVAQAMATASARLIADLAAEACSAYERAVAEAEIGTYLNLARKANAEHVAAAVEAAQRQQNALTKMRARKAAEALHDQPGGSRDKREQIRAIWASGKYQSRDVCAEQECAALKMSFATARKALRGTPEPT